MPILITLFVGAVAGIIVAQIMKLEASLPASMAIGVIGALIGFFILRSLLSLFAAGSTVLSIFIGGIFGAVALIWIYRRFFSGR